MLSSLRRRRHALAFLAPAIVLACGGGGDGGTAPPPVTVASVSVSLASSTLTPGQTTTASAVARDAQGGTIAGKVATWSSSSSAVATVDGSGTVTAVAAGSAEIVATIDGRTGQATVTVTPPPVATVAVTLGSTSLAVGQSTQGQVVLRDANGATLTGRQVAWTSSNPTIASVNGSGLVSGLAVGTATITATSEGRSGAATVTVTPVVSIAAVALRNADGSPADVSRIAGRLRIAADVDVPPTFRGVLEVRIRGILARRDSITPASGVLARMTERLLDVPTAIATVDANTLQASATYPNGTAEILTTLAGVVPGGSPTSVSQSTQVTLRNMDALALVAVDPRTAAAQGQTWIGGPGTQAFVAHVAFGDLGTLNRVEVIRGAGNSVFGAGALAGAVNVITRTGPTSGGTFDLGGSGWESDLSGTGFGFISYELGGVTYTPRTAIASLLGNAASVDASGFYTSPSRAAAITLPSGIRYQETTFNLPSGWVDLSSKVSYLDFLAARAGPGAFEPTPRLNTVGQPAWVPNGTWGISQNYLGANTNLKLFLDLSKFTDDGVGAGALSDVSWHASTSLGTLWQTANQITGVGDIPASTSRQYYLGAAGKDPLDNPWQVSAKTNLANPWTSSGVATGAQLGTTDAIFGRLTSGGSMTWGGVPSGSVFNTTALSGYNVSVTATGSQYDASAFGGAAHRYGDVMQCFMGFTHCMIPEVLTSTVSNGGAQVTTSLSLATLRTRWSALGGGSGAFQLNYAGADLGGNAVSGFQPWIGYLDLVRPTTSVTAVNGQNGDVTVNVTGADNLGAERVDYGARFNLSQSAFSGGKLYSWFHTAEEGGNLTNGLSTSISTSIAGRYPVAGRWYAPGGTGIDRTTVIPTDGICARVSDWARNASQPVCVAHSPTTSPVAVSSGLTNLRAGLTSGTLCNNTTCSGSTPNEVIGWLEADVAGALDELAKMFMLGIPPGGEVFPMGKSESPTVVQTNPNGSRRLRWETRFSNADYCLAFSGLMLVKIIALSSDGWNVFFPSQFLLLNVLAGTGNFPGCTRPPRPLLG